MTTDAQGKRIWAVACLDSSRYSPAVRDYAVWLSQVLNSPLKALHAIEHGAQEGVTDLTGAIGLGAQEYLLAELTELEQQRNKLEIQKGRQMLESVGECARKAGIEHPMLVQRHGSLIESLIDMEEDARVVVLGVRGESHDLSSQKLGAHLESIVRAIHRPIFVVNQPFALPKTAMLAFDGSHCCLKGLDMIKKSPLFDSIPVHIVHVAQDQDDSKANAMVEEAQQVLAQAGRLVSSVVLHGQPQDVLCQYQQDHAIDFTVMGAFSHHRLREFVFGSFTAKMLLKTEKPLLLLR